MSVAFRMGGIVLALAKRMNVPQVPTVEVFGDHENVFTFYAVPVRPTVEVDDRGKPAIRLLVYMKRDGSRRSPAGGQVTVTTMLGVRAEELALVRQWLETGLSARHTPVGPDNPLRVLTPEWTSGAVTVHIGTSLSLTGSPSLFADNRCAMVSPLNAHQAGVIAADTASALAGSSIRYAMTMRIASTASASSVVSSGATSGDGGLRTSINGALAMSARMTSAENHALVVEGALVPGPPDSFVTFLDL